jgi:signal peptidase I
VLRCILFFIGWIICYNAIGPILAYGEFGILNFVICIIMMPAYFLAVVFSAWKTARSADTVYTLKYFNRWYVYALLLVVSFYAYDMFNGLKKFSGLYAIPGFGIYTTYKMPAASMENALLPGDFLVADMTAYRNANPQINDIIVFLIPIDRKTPYVKRCIAGPGDVVEIRDKVLFVNGEKVPDPPTVKYIDEKIHPGDTNRRDNLGPLTIGPDSYFVLGDNRDNSFDSRYWGTVPGENILGIAMRIHWSSDLDRIGLAVQ